MEKQIQWVSLYIERGSADVGKENIIKDLESRNLSYMIIEKFLSDLKE